MAPPIVLHAVRVRRSALIRLLAGAVVVVGVSVLLLPLLGYLPIQLQLLALVAWGVVASSAFGIGASRLAANTRWTVPVLQVYGASLLASQLEDRIERCGEIEPVTQPVAVTIRRLALRIDGLAVGRLWILEMTRTARETASRLDQERRALTRIEHPDAGISELIASLDKDLEALSARLVRVLDRLLCERSAEGLAVLDDGLSRLEADSEVQASSRSGAVQLIRAVQ